MALRMQQIGTTLILGLLVTFPVSALPLHEAVSAGDAEKVRELLTPEFAINEKDPSGMTALQIAVREDNMEMIEILIGNGADVNLHSTRLQFTPLHIAVRKSDEMAKLLIAHGADVNQKNKDGATPLHLAGRTGNSQMVEFLIANGADIDSRDFEEYTPLHNAAWNGHIEAVKILVNNGADINASTYGGDTPYNCAVGKNHDEVSAFLEQLGVIK